jgi:hypothetical protein
MRFSVPNIFLDEGGQKTHLRIKLTGGVSDVGGRHYVVPYAMAGNVEVVSRIAAFESTAQCDTSNARAPA